MVHRWKAWPLTSGIAVLLVAAGIHPALAAHKSHHRQPQREHGFNMKTLEGYEKHAGKVRITGWLFFDNDHPTDLDRQRATLWEIHPVTRIDVCRTDQKKGHKGRKGHWVKVAG